MDAKMKLSIFLLSALMVVPAYSETPSESFPKVEAETLDGKAVDLPDGFGTEKTWVVLGFTKDSQKATGACLDLLERDYKGVGYGAAILQGIPFFIKGTVKKAIRNSVPEVRKGRYLFFFDGKKDLKTLTHFDPTHEDDAYILGLQVSKVIWANHGPCDLAHYSALKAVIQAPKPSK